MTIHNNFNLSHFNSFGVSTICSSFADFSNEIELLALMPPEGESFFILGGGTNVLFTKDFEGRVLRNTIKGIQVEQADSHSVLVKVGAGEIWHDFVMYCIAKNWGGIENLSLIPGTCGAAPIQNIGAYGVEISQVLVSVDLVDLSTKQHFTLSKEDCLFGYRNSIFKQKKQWVITHLRLELSLVDHKLNTDYGAIMSELNRMKIHRPTIKNISDAVINIRQSKLPDPSILGNAGSFFKNPIINAQDFNTLMNKYPNMPNYKDPETELVKIPAGWLIEQAGYKGLRFGNTGSHKDQALVIVNFGGATGTEILEHANRVIQGVQNKFGILLQSEVNII